LSSFIDFAIKSADLITDALEILRILESIGHECVNESRQIADIIDTCDYKLNNALYRQSMTICEVYYKGVRIHIIQTRYRIKLLFTG